MDNRLSDRVAIVTGGSSGIGKATALRFAKSGARVVVADISSTGVEQEITSQYGEDRATFVKVDVTQESEIQALIKAAVDFGGRLDILCNSAGVGLESKFQKPTSMHECPTEIFDKTWAINTRGTWLCNKYAVAQMLNQEPREPNARGERAKGWILNVASVYGKCKLNRRYLIRHDELTLYTGLIGHAIPIAYIPSKHAVVGMTKQMALNYATQRIHVNCLCPGYTKTPMIEAMSDGGQREQFLTSLHPWGALGTAEDMADAALFLCSDESSWVTGQCLAVDGAYTAG